MKTSKTSSGSSSDNFYTPSNENASGGDQNIKYILSKFDYELYDEEKAKKVAKIYRIKKINETKSVSEKWRIFEDTKVIFTLDSESLSKKEKEFLRTPDGFSWLLVEAKAGIKSINSLRKNLKTKIDSLKS